MEIAALAREIAALRALAEEKDKSWRMRALERYNREYCTGEGGHSGGSLRAAAKVFMSMAVAELFMAFPVGEERDKWIEGELNAVHAS